LDHPSFNNHIAPPSTPTTFQQHQPPQQVLHHLRLPPRITINAPPPVSAERRAVRSRSVIVAEQRVKTRTQWRPLQEGNLDHGRFTPPFPRSNGRASAGVAPPQSAIEVNSSQGGIRIKRGSRPLFAGPMAEQRVAWLRLRSRFDPQICIYAPPPVYKAGLSVCWRVGCSWLVVRWSLASAWWSGRRSRRGRLIVGRSGRLVAGLGSCGARSGGRGTSRRSEEEARSSSSHPRLPPRTDQASHFPPPPRASTISLPHSALRKCRKPRSRRGATTRAGARGASRGPHRGRLGVEGGPQGTTTRSGKSRLFFLWGLCK